MKILLTGLRGAGKSTVGHLAAKAIDYPLLSMSDLIRKELPDSKGASRPLYIIIEELPLPRRASIYQRVVNEMNELERFILEMPIVEWGDFGLLVPSEPVIRSVQFGAFLALEANPHTIRKRRRERQPKGQDQRYLEETHKHIEMYQELARQALVGLGAALTIPVFVIHNNSNPEKAAREIIAAIATARRDAEFNAYFTKRS